MRQLYITILIVAVLLPACPRFPLGAQCLPDSTGGTASDSALSIHCVTIDTLFADQKSRKYINNPFQLKATITNPTDVLYTNVRLQIRTTDGILPTGPKPEDPGTIAPHSSVEVTYYLIAEYLRAQPTNAGVRVDVFTDGVPLAHCASCVHITALYRPELDVACRIEPSDTLHFNDRTGWTDLSELRVRAQISNTGPGQAYNVRGKLILPGNMTLAAGEAAAKFLDPLDLSPGSSGSLEWRVQPGSISRQGWVDFDVLVALEKEDTVKCTTRLYLEPFSRHVELSFPEYSFVRSGEQRNIPLRLGGAAGVGLSEYALLIHYDPAMLRINGVSTPGTLTELGWTAATVRNINDETVEISATGTALETEEGVLLNLQIEGVLERQHGAGSFGWSILHIDTIRSTLNRGAISFTAGDGNVIATDDCLEPLVHAGGSTLKQNRPNPFNPSTVIEYTLPSDEYIRLRVFDSHGRDVAVLVEGMQERGTHSVTFNAEQLPSGMYFYRLETPRGFETRKMLLMR